MRLTDFAGRPNGGAAHQGPLTVGASAGLLTALTGALHAQTQFVIVHVEAQPIRYTVNGTTPTSTLGFSKAADSQILLSRAEAEGMKLIRQGATNATIQVAQYLE